MIFTSTPSTSIIAAAISFILSATTTHASPLLRTRTTGCANFPLNGLASMPAFTLHAYYGKDAGTNVTLGLVSGGSGGSTSSGLFFLGNSDDPTQFTLQSSILQALSSQTNNVVAASTGPSNSVLTFVPEASLDGSSPSDTDDEYCILVNTSPHGSALPGPVLAVNDSADRFSICETQAADADVVVFNVGADTKNATQTQIDSTTAVAFDSSSCTPVHIVVVPVQ